MASYPIHESSSSSSAATSSHPLKKRTGRHILPLQATPSLTTQTSSLQGRIVDPEYAQIKGSERIIDYHLKCLFEIHLDVSFERGPTVDQGHRAKRSFQAAHHSLLPNPQDKGLEKFIRKVGATGITPTKSGPYLRARANLSEAEIQEIATLHPDEKTLRNFLQPRLPIGADSSSLAGTSTYLFSNSTIDNPDESNQLDSLLERKIAPFLQCQQQLRKEGTLDAIASTENLVKWLTGFYRKCLDSCEQRKGYLQKAEALLENLEDKENGISPFELIEEILKIATLKLTCLPSHRIPKSLETTFRSLKVQEPTNLIEIKKQLHTLITTFKKKTELFEAEAQAQLKQLDSCDGACTIPSLQKALFGIYEDGARRAPTNEEIRDQLFDMLHVDPTYQNGSFKKQRRARSLILPL
jgi:hypothetical protein